MGAGWEEGLALAVAPWSVEPVLPMTDHCWPGPLGHTFILCLKDSSDLGGPSWVQRAVSGLLFPQVLPHQWRGPFHHLWSHGRHKHQELWDGGRGLGVVSTGAEGAGWRWATLWLSAWVSRGPLCLSQLLLDDRLDRPAQLRPRRAGVLGPPSDHT